MTPHEIAFLSLAIPVAAGALAAVGYALYHLLRPLRPQTGREARQVVDYQSLLRKVAESEGLTAPNHLAQVDRIERLAAD